MGSRWAEVESNAGRPLAGRLSSVSLAKHRATRQHTLAAAALVTALDTALERLEDVRVEKSLGI